ncbi:hypothetical protein SMSP2_00484 [Limihaloglobus sulfuriphilus]|uniref:Uncharacterized protein n=1 Tax=Limihaloglobus sulfuriphilus TaxID=1851148 RepID=A0A1Q2MD11_9BACT|nr:hypothetical protein [Limihaloglobus sulfuriphilus]AQQ70142.1 hypothetical protein SMSP2_00484 [Limihaloglobus sulfuriphilus]
MKVFAAAAALAIVLAGCFPTLYPLFTEQDLVFEKDLLGCWTIEESMWTFEHKSDKTYLLTIVEKEDGQTFKGDFAAHLVKLDGKLFLDITPADLNKINTPDISKICLYPMHLFMKVDEISPELKISLMEPEWLEEYLKENPEKLPFVPKDKNRPLPLITASTSQLQTLVKENADNVEAWTKPAAMTRCGDKPDKASK